MNRRTVAVVAVAVTCAALLRSRKRAAAGVTGAVGNALADWVPAPPTTTRAQIAARIWAAPMTLVGLLAGVASGARPQLREGVVLFAPARGLAAAAVRWRGFAAVALGHVVLALEEPSPELLTHELVHVRQAERLGPLMAPAYLGLLAVHGYARHPMEHAARLAAAGEKGVMT